MKFYTGIGSRTTPMAVQIMMHEIAGAAVKSGYILRSGGADGADTAFEVGCRDAGGDMRIFLPWQGFNNNRSPLCGVGEKALHIASTIHPYWPRLRKGARKLMARNVYQILGYNLKVPSKFVVCWTPDGCTNDIQYSPEHSGGTGMAIALASKNGIPVYNLRRTTDYQQVIDLLKEGG